MSVIGIDLGYQTSTISAPKGGGIETLLNEYSQRQTASCVSFSEKQRELGEAGRQKAVTKFKSTVSFFKKFIGRQFKDADVQAEIANAHYRAKEMADGTVGFTCTSQGEDRDFSVVQITAMLLGQLRRAAMADLASTKLTDCVIGVPVGFTDVQRHAMLASAKIAGLNCLKIFNETTATALAYGIYKQDLPAEGEKPRRVVFADCGHSNFQLCAADFIKGKLIVRATASASVGGRDFDRLIFEHFAEEFKGKYKIDVKTNSRASIRLETECEKMKKLMSANATPVRLNIECLMDDKDVSGQIKREDFEAKATEQFALIEATCNQLLANLSTELEGKSKLEDIDFVEIVGGTVRMPMIKSIIAKVFGQDTRTTLNLDEAVSRGCALQAAISSPTFRVRDFAVSDKTAYGINLNWTSTDGETSNAELYKDNGTSGLTKVLTFFRDADFVIESGYANADAIPGGVATIGSYTLKGVTPGFDGKSQKVKAKFKIDEHGCFKIDDAHMIEKLAPQAEPEPAAADADAAKEDAGKKDEPEKDAAPAEPDAKKAKAAEPETKKAKTSKNTPLEIVAVMGGVLTAAEVNGLIEAENALFDCDRAEKEKSDAKNALEEYIYAMRDNVSGKYEEYMAEADREKYSAQLTKYEDWLYDEGEDVAKSVYNGKLDELKSAGMPVEKRYTEAEARKPAIDALNQAVFACRKFLSDKASGDEKYAHLTEEDMKKVGEQFATSEKNCNEWVPKLASLAKTENPPILASAFVTEAANLERVYVPVMNKPAPVVEPPPADVPVEAEGGAEGKPYGAAEEAAAPAADAPAAEGAEATPAAAASSMEVD